MTADSVLNGGVTRSGHARFVQRIARRYAAQQALLAPGMPDWAAMQALFDALRAQGADVPSALRIVRQCVIARLADADCAGQAQDAPGCSLEAVTQAMTTLAEWALEIAFAHSHQALAEQHGTPTAANGQAAQLAIVGMGKFGARELNVSSDIDLIYLYDHDGETTGDASGRGRIANQEFFGKQVRAMYALIGETTEHGMVFRVDLALRPNGNSGPSSVSLAALETYFEAQGREWERFAWLKSRIVAPQAARQGAFAHSLRGIVVPFVFRRYLDYGVFDALRVLHRQIRSHASKRSAGHPERGNDVKLSRGGIREIEFTVQLLQVVRGGQFPELRTRPTVKALQHLAAAQLMPQDTADSLAQAYVFLRQVEHRIQYLDDQQTHVLPTADADLHWIAHTMGLADASDLLRVLDSHRERVTLEFDALLGGANADCKNCGPSDSTRAHGKPGSSPAGSGAVFAPPSGELDHPELEQLIARTQGPLRTQLERWQTHPRVLALRDASRVRLLRLMGRTLHWLAQGHVTEQAAVRWTDWVEPLLRRESYLALLMERPRVHQRLLRILGAARWPARYLLKHPGVIDELAQENLLHERFASAEFAAELERRRAALQASGEDDDETLLNLLRRAHHAEVFRILARDVEGMLTVEQVADDLSALADTLLRTTAHWCWARLKNRHAPHEALEDRFAILAYGKLGGKELGYGSDLDIVFVYDDADERAMEIYGALVRKLINWLTVKTSEGDLYEIDTALRPNGSSGLLITRFSAYADYQQQRGSNTAWTWEHQAMTRARCVLGSAALQQRFEAVRSAVLATPRDNPRLRAEIQSMRHTVRSAHPVPPPDVAFDLKHSAGGMVDIEFVVQFLVLAYSDQHPSLRENVGNIALLQRAQACGLVPAPLGEQAAQAYRTLRQMQHTARLNEDSTQAAAHATAQERQAGLALWDAVLGG